MTDERKGLSKASLRGLRSKRRMEKMRAAAPAGIRVVPASDDIRRVMKHPTRGAFPADGSAEWPDDRFTKRRLADGSVTREADAVKAEHHDKGPPRPRHQDKDPNNSAA